MTLEADLKYWVAIARAPAIGTKLCLGLIKQFSNIAELFDKKNFRFLEKSLSTATLNYLANPDWHGVEQDLKWASQMHCYLISLNHPAYPSYLREIADPPFLLYVKGCPEALTTPQIALVGSRNPSFSGRETAFQFAHDLAKRQLTITSGLAYGIDSHGHEGALKANGRTIAVLGSGINAIYPKKHTSLAEKIMTTGAIISEFPPETPPLAGHFPRRNRIISGLCYGVLVVEATLKSGSLITARLANEQGRDVFAIPGSIHNTFAQGCHHLIQTGAKLVTTINDILEEFSSLIPHPMPPKSNQPLLKKSSLSSPQERKIWNCIDFEPAPMDTIALRSGLTIGEVSSILLSFEINGLIVSTPMGYLRTHRIMNEQSSHC